MFIVDLQCVKGHTFEGWYDTKPDYYERAQAGEITCPMCNTSKIIRRPSAGRIKNSLRKLAYKPFSNLAQMSAQKAKRYVSVTSMPQIPIEAQKAIARILKKIKETHEDVGKDFSRHAIAMELNKEEKRPIVGESTPEDEEKMDDEGVPYFKIPVPDIEQN